MIRPIAAFLVIALLGTGRGGAQAPSAILAGSLPSITLPAELDRVLRDYEREWKAASPTGLAGLFTEDGFVLQPGQPPVRGRAGIIKAYDEAGGSLALRALAYAASDTVGYIIGAYASKPGQPDAGKFILLVRRVRGGPWRIAADMDNGSHGR